MRDERERESTEKRILLRNTISVSKTHSFLIREPPNAAPGGGAIKVVSLRPFDCWDCGFESY
jgi:hypothetical protein